MNLENQVSSLVLSKQLKDLGIKQESLWVYVDTLRGYKIILNRPDSDIFKVSREQISAFTVAELGEMLPTVIELESKLTGKKEKKGMGFLADDIEVQTNNFYGVEKYRIFIIEIGKFQVSEKTEADARAKMLVYLLENKLIHI